MSLSEQQENKALRKRLSALMTHARQNEQILQRFQAQELRLMSAGSYQDLLEHLLRTHRQAFELNAVSLVLLDAQYELQRQLLDLDIDAAGYPELFFIDNHRLLLGLFEDPARPVLGPYRQALHGWLFGERAPVNGSLALLPLIRNGQLIGCFNLFSRDESRFIHGTATDFLEHLAVVAAISLENVINSEKLKNIGLTDPLTGVYNRRYFDKRLDEELLRVLRNGAPLCCLFLDIDCFKRVNDSYGHPIGDQVLQETARRIKAQLRLSDALARYGGEEFAVLLVATEETEALVIAERIRAAVAGEYFATSDGGGLSVTLSIGVSALGPPGPRHDEGQEQGARLLAEADQALYRAKQNGRNQVVPYRMLAGNAPGRAD